MKHILQEGLFSFAIGICGTHKGIAGEKLKQFTFLKTQIYFCFPSLDKQ